MTFDERFQWAVAVVALRKGGQIGLVVEEMGLAVDNGGFALDPVSEAAAVFLGWALQIEEL